MPQYMFELKHSLESTLTLLSSSPLFSLTCYILPPLPLPLYNLPPTTLALLFPFEISFHRFLSSPWNPFLILVYPSLIKVARGYRNPGRQVGRSRYSHRQVNKQTGSRKKSENRKVEVVKTLHNYSREYLTRWIGCIPIYKGDLGFYSIRRASVSCILSSSLFYPLQSCGRISGYCKIVQQPGIHPIPRL